MLKAGKYISIQMVLVDIEINLVNIRGSNALSAENLQSVDKAFYFTALQLLCEPISKLINSEHKDILCGLGFSLPTIEDAFCQFRYIFLALR